MDNPDGADSKLLSASELQINRTAFQARCRAMNPKNAAVVIACVHERAGDSNSAGAYLKDLSRRHALVPALCSWRFSDRYPTRSKSRRQVYPFRGRGTNKSMEAISGPGLSGLMVRLGTLSAQSSVKGGVPCKRLLKTNVPVVDVSPSAGPNRNGAIALA